MSTKLSLHKQDKRSFKTIDRYIYICGAKCTPLIGAQNIRKGNIKDTDNSKG